MKGASCGLTHHLQDAHTVYWQTQIRCKPRRRVVQLRAGSVFTDLHPSPPPHPVCPRGGGAVLVTTFGGTWPHHARPRHPRRTLVPPQGHPIRSEEFAPGRSRWPFALAVTAGPMRVGAGGGGIFGCAWSRGLLDVGRAPRVPPHIARADASLGPSVRNRGFWGVFWCF